MSEFNRLNGNENLDTEEGMQQPLDGSGSSIGMVLRQLREEVAELNTMMRSHLGISFSEREQSQLHIPPKLCNLTGPWDGIYAQLGRRYPFTLTIESDSMGAFAGYISEPTPPWSASALERLTAEIEGHVDLRTGDVLFTKVYIGSPICCSIRYHGMLWGQDYITGRWALSGVSDVFSMTRRR